MDNRLVEDMDLSVKRVGSAHAESVISGRSFCNICGYIDEAKITDTVLEWHADSFVEE